MSTSKILDKAIKMLDASNEEKDRNFRMLNKEIRHLAEHGDFDEISKFVNKFNSIVSNNAISKSDANLINKYIAEAQRNAKKR